MLLCICCEYSERWNFKEEANNPFILQVCINTKCQDPCKVGGTCGINAHCRVRNHYSDCYCPEGFFGDPYSQCRPVPRPPPTTTGLSCPSPECGPNSICEVSYKKPKRSTERTCGVEA